MKKTATGIIAASVLAMVVATFGPSQLSHTASRTDAAPPVTTTPPPGPVGTPAPVGQPSRSDIDTQALRASPLQQGQTTRGDRVVRVPGDNGTSLSIVHVHPAPPAR